MIEQGRIHSVVFSTLGSRLATPAAVNDTALTVDDVSDFNEEGGVLSLNGVQYTYTFADFDTAVLTLAAPVTVAGVVPDRVDVWPLTPEKYALVVGEGVEDALSIRVPHALMPFIPEGIRDEDQRESVQYVEQAGELVITDVVGKAPVLDGASIDPTTLPPAGSDGNAPGSSPSVQLTPGIRTFFGRLDPVANADPVIYDLHVSASSTLGSDYGPATLFKSDPSTFVSIGALPGPEPAPGVVDPRVLLPGTTYYFLVVARDADGAAAPSPVVSAQLTQITGPDIAANTITGDQIVAGSITGAELAVEVALASVFRTATSGQRTEFGVNGIQQYRADESYSLNFPNDGTENLIDAEVIARGLTVKDGASLEGASELRAGSSLTLTSGVTAPSMTPQLATYYDTIHPVLTSGGLGPLGAFGLNPSEVSFVEWNATAARFHIYQVRSGGTRIWKCDTAGNLTHTSADDVKNWKIYGQTTIPLGANAGTYFLFQYIPSGVWMISAPGGIVNTYTRTNTSRIPAIGNSGFDLFVAEALANNSMRVTYHTLAANNQPLPAAHTTYTTGTGLFGASPVYAGYGDFDFGADTQRHVFAERGVAYNAKSFSKSGTTLVQQNGEAWEAPTTRMGQCWDGTQFWTYGSDGTLYKHTSNKWDTSVSSSVYWAKTTYYDSNVAGTGIHETGLGPVKSIVAPRRGSIRVTMPPVPGAGGVDDPNAARLYMARGATQPADSALKLQYSGAAASYTFTTLATTTSHAAIPFPGSVPAWIDSSASILQITGAGNAQFVDVDADGDLTQGGVPVVTTAMIKGGRTTPTCNAGVATITHDLGTTPNWAVATTEGTQTYWVSITSRSATTFTIMVASKDAGTYTGSAVPINWMVGL